jgi:hypothetical protein
MMKKHLIHCIGDGLCYKPEMAKTIGQWLLLKCVDGEVTTLSGEPFKTKKLAEKARLKYPAKERKTIIVGMIRIKL